MAKRRAKNERADETPRDRQRERARALLSRAGIAFDPAANDVELADLLLRNLRTGDDTWRDTAIELLLADAEIESRTYLLRECYFLEGWKIAEEAIARLVVDAGIGRYDREAETPLARLRRAIRAAVLAHLADPEFCLIPPTRDDGAAPMHHRIAHEIAKAANVADDLTRRILWRTWIDRMDLRSAADSLATPLESVEQVMMRLGAQAHDRLGRGDEYRAWLANRPHDGYRTPGGAPGDSGDDFDDDTQDRSEDGLEEEGGAS